MYNYNTYLRAGLPSMNIKRNPISACNMVFFFIITTPFLRGYCNRLCPSVRSSVSPSVCMLCSILLSHWTKSNQVWCARFSYEWGVRQHFLGPSPWGPGEGSKVNYQIRKVNFKDFIPNFMFVLKKKKWDFHYVAWVILQGVGLGVACGSIFFPNMVVWHIKLKGMVSRTGNKLNVHPMVKLVTLRYSQ